MKGQVRINALKKEIGKIWGDTRGKRYELGGILTRYSIISKVERVRNKRAQGRVGSMQCLNTVPTEKHKVIDGETNTSKMELGWLRF